MTLVLDMNKILKLSAERIIDILHNMDSGELSDFFNLIFLPQNSPSIGDKIQLIFENQGLWKKILDANNVDLLLLKKGVGTIGGHLLSVSPNFIEHQIFYTRDILSIRSSTISTADRLTKENEWILRFYKQGYSLTEPIYVLDKKYQKIEIGAYISQRNSEFMIVLAKDEAEMGLPLGNKYPGLQLDLRPSPNALVSSWVIKNALLEQLGLITDSPKNDVHRIMALLASTVGLDAEADLYNLFAKKISDYLNLFGADEYKSEVAKLLAAKSCCDVGRTIIETYVLAKERLAKNLEIFESAIDHSVELEDPKLPGLLF